MIDWLIHRIHSLGGWNDRYPLWLNITRLLLMCGAWFFFAVMLAIIVFTSVQEFAR